MPALLLTAAASGASPPLQRKHPQTSPPWVHPQPGQLLPPSPPLDGIFITGIKLSNKV